jgi:hypothetical protein
MKKIGEYRKLLGVTKAATLAELKTIYRNLVKEWHPDKFAQDSEEKHAAEEKSKAIIEAYHFLVSIAPETLALQAPGYTTTTATSPIVEIIFEEKVLEVKFADGSAYEYFGVPKELYIKFANAPSPTRFGRRHIYGAFVYRQASKTAA